MGVDDLSGTRAAEGQTPGTGACAGTSTGGPHSGEHHHATVVHRSGETSTAAFRLARDAYAWIDARQPARWSGVRLCRNPFCKEVR